uniref:Uncharacterized protein n=1 Tax=Solanum tuberosum TaxID=4113 RepID=M1DQJ7_SOLTU
MEGGFPIKITVMKTGKKSRSQNSVQLLGSQVSSPDPCDLFLLLLILRLVKDLKRLTCLGGNRQVLSRPFLDRDTKPTHY